MADPSETTQVGAGPPEADTHVATGPGATGPGATGRGATGRGEVLDAIHELSGRVGSLQAEVRTLRAQTRSLPAAGSEGAGWDDPRGGGADTPTWVRALDAPAHRGPAVPRLFLEIVFLVSVAVAAAIAELEVAEIVGVMAVAWVLVALAEFTAARSARRRAEAVFAPYPGLAPGYPTDPSWFAPPVERTVLDVVETGADSHAKLPPPNED